MFLTRIALDTRRPETSRLLATGDSLRMAVLSTFAGGNMQPLFRIDEYGSRTWLVMLTWLRPTLAALHQACGYPGVFPSWETFPLDDLLEAAEEGSRWDFDLVGAPFGMTDAPDPPFTQESLIHYLENVQLESGFSLIDTEVVSAVPMAIACGHMLLVRWRGRLMVTAPDMFRWAMSSGFGAGQDYGAGLMTLDWVY